MLAFWNKQLWGLAILVLAGSLAGKAFAASSEVEMFMVNGEGTAEEIGYITIEETGYGLLFTPNVGGLPPGTHGFHIHTKGSCAPSIDPNTGAKVPAGDAGGHFDPAGTGKHSSPWDDSGHLGDLPVLYVDSQGNSVAPVLAPRLKTLEQVRDRALMIHTGGDSHSDHPVPLGGAGGRLGCGIIR